MIRFTIPGDPVGKSRARSTKAGHHYTPYKTRAYEKRVARAAQAAMLAAGLQPLTGPVQLIIVCRFAVPKSWPEWKRTAALEHRIRPTGKPDIDNVCKSVTDGLNGIAWLDDAQVVQIVCEKSYSATPEVTVIVDSIQAASANAKRAEVAA